METEHGDKVYFEGSDEGLLLLERFLTELARGPLGAALLELAAGRSQIVVKQHASKSGWVIRAEAIGDRDSNSLPE